jgi:hypothetical protein
VVSVSIIRLLKLGTRLRLIRGGEAFKETNLTHVFVFLMYDYVTAVYSLIKEIYACVFENFHDSSRSLTAVSEKPPYNRRLSPMVKFVYMQGYKRGGIVCSVYKTACTLACKKLYHTFTYNRLPEHEPSGWKHVKYIVKIKI